MPAGLLLTVPEPAPAAFTLSWTEPVGKLELLPPPPQPESTTSTALKQQTTAPTFGPGIELPPFVSTRRCSMVVVDSGLPCLRGRLVRLPSRLENFFSLDGAFVGQMTLQRGLLFKRFRLATPKL